MMWRGLKFNIDNPEVYPPKPATLLLAEAALKVAKPGGNFLEIGTGAGAVAIAVARFVRVARVTASDINVVAIKVASLNAKLNRVKIRTVVGDLFEPFARDRFDVIAIHPPAVPYPIDKSWGLTRGMTIATDGGYDGSNLMVLSLSQAVRHLKPGGRLLLLLPQWSNTRKAYDVLSNHYRYHSHLI